MRHDWRNAVRHSMMWWAAASALLLAQVSLADHRPGHRVPPGRVDAGSDGGTRDGGAIDAGTDAGTPDAGSPDAGATDAGTPDAGSGGGTDWLSVVGNRILLPNGQVWKARGANVPDTRSCNACTWTQPNVGEVKRRIDEIVSWGASFIRLNLESYASSGGRVHWQTILEDPQYLADIQSIVAHVGTKPGVRVMLTLHVDPTVTSLGWPTEGTRAEWRKLAEVFRDVPHVLYGVVNEPAENWDGSLDPQVWGASNMTVAAIRA